MFLPTISVIIPVYNTEKYLHRCIDSILAQTFTNFELLLVDDGSTDNSGKICDEYAKKDSRVRVFHKENGGVSSARNVGLDNARGEWIAFVDSDDWIEHTMYKSLYDKVILESADIAYCEMRMVYEDKDEIYKGAKYEVDKISMLQNYIVSVWTCLVIVFAKRSLYKNYNLKSPTHLSYCEDFWLAVRLMFYANKIVKVPFVLYNYDRTNEYSAIHTLSRKAEKEEQNAYLETIAFFEREGVLRYYIKQMGWRILKSKQELVLCPDRHKEFMSIFPKSHNYIFDCPYINIKLKIMMWLLTHHLRFILRPILSLRSLIRN